MKLFNVNRGYYLSICNLHIIRVIYTFTIFQWINIFIFSDIWLHCWNCQKGKFAFYFFLIFSTNSFHFIFFAIYSWNAIFTIFITLLQLTPAEKEVMIKFEVSKNYFVIFLLMKLMRVTVLLLQNISILKRS